MEAKYLKINPADNVAVAITALPAGEKLTVDGKGITLNEDVPAGHKFALKDFAEGENVIKYGYPIGHARKAQKQGDWMNENNIKTNLSGLLEYTYNPVNVDLNTTTLNLNTGAPNLTFRGYKRRRCAQRDMDYSDSGLRERNHQPACRRPAPRNGRKGRGCHHGLSP